MKLYRLITCAAVFFAAMTMSEDVAAQVLSFETKRIEAGEISEDDTPVYEYVGTNTGDRPVTIYRMTTSCGSCLKAESDKAVIGPGEKAKITVSYFPKGHPGKFERRVFIFTDPSATSPTETLELAVSVSIGDDLNPYFPVNMGKIRLKTSEMTFRRGRNDGISLQYLDVTGKNFKPEADGKILPPFLKVTVTDPETFAEEEGEYLDEAMRGKVGAVTIRFIADDFPEERGTGWFPVMLDNLGLSPTASMIKVYIE